MVVTEIFVKGLVFVFGDVFFGARPQRVGRVDGFPLVGGDVLTRFFVPGLLAHFDGQADVVRVLLNDLLDLPSL